MADQATYYVCEGCREPVSPGDTDVVRAVELVPVQSFGGAPEMLDGLAVLFHRSCFPDGSPAYRLEPV